MVTESNFHSKSPFSGFTSPGILFRVQGFKVQCSRTFAGSRAVVVSVPAGATNLRDLCGTCAAL